MLRARGLACPSCPRHLHTPYPVLLCVLPIHGAGHIYLPLGCLVKESFPQVSESAGHQCQVASCISMCGLFCGLGNLILTQSLI